MQLIVASFKNRLFVGKTPLLIKYFTLHLCPSLLDISFSFFFCYSYANRALIVQFGVCSTIFWLVS